MIHDEGCQTHGKTGIKNGVAVNLNKRIDIYTIILNLDYKLAEKQYSRLGIVPA
jgi:hypothetical protein